MRKNCTSGAAKRLFISQPALSFDIRKFEDELGVALLVRTSKLVALTNAGEVLLGEARRLLLQAEEAARLTVRSASGLGGRLRVGFVNSMLYRGLPQAVARFGADHPGVEIVLKEMNTHEQANAIRRAQIDLGYAHWGSFPADISAETIYAEPFECCLPAAHRLAGHARLALSALAAEPFILFPRDVAPHYHDLIIAQCVQAGFSPLIRHEARLWQTVLSMVEFGMGGARAARAAAGARRPGALRAAAGYGIRVADVAVASRGRCRTDRGTVRRLCARGDRGAGAENVMAHAAPRLPAPAVPRVKITLDKSDGLIVESRFWSRHGAVRTRRDEFVSESALRSQSTLT